MAQTLEELVVKIAADTSQLRSEMLAASKSSETATTNIQKSIEDMSKNSAKSLSFFDTALATTVGYLGGQLVAGALSTLSSGVQLLTDSFKESITEINAEEQALQKLANSLALNGNYTEEAMKSLEAYIEATEVLTGVTPKQTAANLALLQSMTKLNTEGLMQAQSAAIDLASAYDLDLDSAVRLVGKGIEGNVEAFKRYGIQVKEGTDRSSNLANILDALSGASGSAQGQMRTFNGSVILLSKSWGDMFDAIAKVITQNPVVKAMMNTLSALFLGVAEDASKSGNAMKDTFGRSIIFIAEAMEIFIGAVDIMTRSLQSLLNIGTAALASFFEASAYLFGEVEAQAENALKPAQDRWKKVEESFTESTALGSLRDAFGALATSGTNALGEIAKSSEVVKPTLSGATEETKKLTAAQIAYNEALSGFATGLADQGAALNFAYTTQLEMLNFQHEQELISKQDYYDQSLELLLANQAAEDEALAAARDKGLIDQARYEDARTALTAKQNKEAMDFNKKFTSFEKDSQKTREANFASSLSTIASLSSSSNKTLAAIGKAAAISAATIDGYAAVQKALASAPPPFNFALAGLVGVATAANIAKIAGVQLATGIDSVPGVGSRDNFPAILAPGERVVPKKTNQDLTKFLNQQQSQPRQVTVNINISNNLPSSREAGAEMIDMINEALANGSLRLLGNN